MMLLTLTSSERGKSSLGRSRGVGGVLRNWTREEEGMAGVKERCREGHAGMGQSGERGWRAQIE